MFNPKDLERIIDLHQRAWEFLNRTRGSSEVRTWRWKGADRYDATNLEVLRVFAASQGIVVGPEDIGDFAHLYDSFFSTSQSSFWHTVPMGPLGPSSRRKAAIREDAFFLKRIVAREYADENDLPFTDTEIYNFCQRKDLTRTLALVTYTYQLLRRTEFPGQGKGVLLLWREFSWEEGHLKKGFRLSAEMVLEAEATLVAASKQYAELC